MGINYKTVEVVDHTTGPPTRIRRRWPRRRPPQSPPGHPARQAGRIPKQVWAHASRPTGRGGCWQLPPASNPVMRVNRFALTEY